jgi:hypothetical protein
MYQHRDIQRDAASRAARIPLDALDKWVRRFHLGGKRKGARVFSLRDLIIATTARALAGPDRTLAECMAIVEPLLADRPARDAVLIVTATGAWLQPDEADWPHENCTIIYVGQRVEDLEANLVAV